MHFLRNLLAQVPKGSAEMVAAAIRTIFAEPDAAHVREQLDTIAGMLGRQFPKVEILLRDAAADVTAFADFPVAHWEEDLEHQPIGRLNKEIKRRIDVVGVFPNPPALLRLAGTVLAEAHDEWQVSDRRYLSERSMALLLTPPVEEVVTAELVSRIVHPRDPPGRLIFHHVTGRDADGLSRAADPGRALPRRTTSTIVSLDTLPYRPETSTLTVGWASKHLGSSQCGGLPLEELH